MKSFREFINETPKDEFFGGSRTEAETYVDLDGVLADFHSAAEKALGRKITGGSDITGADWKVIEDTDNFWADMDFLRSGKKLWSHIRRQKPFILSALPRTDTAGAQKGKIAWVGRNLSGVSKDRIILVLRADKKKFAVNTGGRPNLLIDDNAKNISEWKAAGGIGILHHSTTVNQTIARLKKLGY